MDPEDSEMTAGIVKMKKTDSGKGSIANSKKSGLRIMPGSASAGKPEKPETIADVIRIRQRRAILQTERRSFVTKILSIAVAAFLLMTTVFGIAEAEGIGMFPAIKDGDVVLYFRLGREYRSGDVVVYRHDGGTYIGRIAAVGGSEIGKTAEGLLLIDGRIHPIQERNGIYYDTEARSHNSYPLTLDTGEFFVLGDQRERAEDSRDFGPVNKKDIKGKVFTLLRKRGL